MSSASNEFLRIFQEEAKEEWPLMIKKVIKTVKEEGNIQGFKLICEYMIGKPTETINIQDDSDHNSIPQFATEEARERAMEIVNRAMAEINNISEEQGACN